MGRGYSDDLRERVAASVAGGRSCRATAALFGASVATAVRWAQRHRATGSAVLGAQGCRHPRSLAVGRGWLLGRLASKPDVTLRGLVAEPGERGARIVISPHPGRAQKLRIDASIYTWRHRIEDFSCKLQEFKRIALRACKTDRRFEAMIYLAAAHAAPRCLAMTRRRTACQSPAVPNGRRRLHGGFNPGAAAGNRNALKTRPLPSRDGGDVPGGGGAQARVAGLGEDIGIGGRYRDRGEDIGIGSRARVAALPLDSSLLSWLVPRQPPGEADRGERA